MFNKLIDYLWSSFRLGESWTGRWQLLWKQTKNLRVGLNLDSHNPGDVYSLRTNYGLLHFRDNFGDITNLANIFHRNTYKVTELAHEGVILDIGANVGLAAAYRRNGKRAAASTSPNSKMNQLFGYAKREKL